MGKYCSFLVTGWKGNGVWQIKISHHGHRLLWNTTGGWVICVGKTHNKRPRISLFFHSTVWPTESNHPCLWRATRWRFPTEQTGECSGHRRSPVQWGLYHDDNDGTRTEIMARTRERRWECQMAECMFGTIAIEWRITIHNPTSMRRKGTFEFCFPDQARLQQEKSWVDRFHWSVVDNLDENARTCLLMNEGMIEKLIMDWQRHKSTTTTTTSRGRIRT